MIPHTVGKWLESAGRAYISHDWTLTDVWILNVSLWSNMKMQGWTFPHDDLCGLVLLQGWDVQRRRGPSAPLLQLPVLEEEVEGGQRDTRLCLGLTERVRYTAVRVRALSAVLPTQRGKCQRSDEQIERMRCAGQGQSKEKSNQARGDKLAVRLSEAVFQNIQRHVAEIMCIKHPDRVKRLSCVTTEVRHMDKSSRIKLHKYFLLSLHPHKYPHPFLNLSLSSPSHKINTHWCRKSHSCRLSTA